MISTLSLKKIIEEQLPRLKKGGEARQITKKRLIEYLGSIGEIPYKKTKLKLDFRQFKTHRELFIVCPKCSRPCRKLYLPALHCQVCKGWVYKDRYWPNIASQILKCMDSAHRFPKKAKSFLEQAEKLTKKIKRKLDK